MTLRRPVPAFLRLPQPSQQTMGFLIPPRLPNRQTPLERRLSHRIPFNHHRLPIHSRPCSLNPAMWTATLGSSRPQLIYSLRLLPTPTGLVQLHRRPILSLISRTKSQTILCRKQSLLRSYLVHLIQLHQIHPVHPHLFSPRKLPGLVHRSQIKKSLSLRPHLSRHPL